MLSVEFRYLRTRAWMCIADWSSQSQVQHM